MSDNILNMSDKLRGDSTEQFERCQQIAITALAQNNGRQKISHDAMNEGSMPGHQ